MRSKRGELLNIVNSEFEKAKKNYELIKKAAQEINASASASPSQSGDRFHAQGAADLAKQKLEAITNLKNEIELAVDENTPDVVTPPCFVNFGGEEIYLVDNVVTIGGLKFVSSKSPLGQNLLGKKVGDNVQGKEILELG